MAFGVFMHRTDSIYDDVPSERYQFPSVYLKRARQCEGDWILYLEPRKIRNTKGYFAVAHVQEIIPDRNRQNMFVAQITPGTYLDFGDPVPFRDDSGLLERGLLNPSGNVSGRAQAAIRTVSTQDFNRIVARGLGRDDDILPRRETPRTPTGLDEETVPYVIETERQRQHIFGSRAIRDRNFRKTVLRAYNETCAITGLRLINGGGRAEVEAAHIRPVHQGGPDLTGNGLALSGTAHWMFDRGLVSFTDQLDILISRYSNDPASIRAMVNPTGKLLVPSRPADRPRPEFISWHRENCFKH